MLTLSVLCTLLLSGDYGYGGFGEDQYTDYYSTYENYSSAGANQPGVRNARLVKGIRVSYNKQTQS